MKKLIYFFVATRYILLCGSTLLGQEIKGNPMIYGVTVTRNDNPVPHAKIIIVLRSQKEIFLSCDKNGYVEFETSEPIAIIYGATRGLTGAARPEYSREVFLPLTEVETKNKADRILAVNSINSSSKTRTGTFAVYSTNSDGDVTFEYMGDAKNYFCTSWLPDLSSGDKKYRPNPNNWDKKSVSGFKSPYKGKLLYVQRRYREFHKYFYSWSISSALFMEAKY